MMTELMVLILTMPASINFYYASALVSDSDSMCSRLKMPTLMELS